MLQSLNNKIETIQNNDVEKSANFQGNETLLLYERLHNPTIRKRLVDMICEYQDSIDPPERYFINDKEVPVSLWKKEIKTREQIEQELDQRLNNFFSMTEIDLTKDITESHHVGEGFGLIYIYGLNPDTNKNWTKKELGIAEAHEKGHGIRNFFDAGKSFKEKIRSGFDFSNVEVQENLLPNEPGTPKEILVNNVLDYFMHVPEIIERMAQLKNYFGMSGAEEFTKEHLDYAKRHYSNDTGMGEIQIKLFFDAITPKTEKRFLELMNTLGI